LNLRLRLITHHSFQARGISIGALYITRLHVEHDFFSNFSSGSFDGLDKTAKRNRLIITNIEECIGPLARGNNVLNTQYALDNIINISEIALHLTVIENFDRITLQDGIGKQPGRHIRPPGWAINSKESQACNWNAV